MQDESIYYNVIDYVLEDCFYDVRNKYIWRALTQIADRNESLDMLTVRSELKKMAAMEEVTELYLLDIYGRIGTNSSASKHALILRELYMRRQAINVGHTMIDKGYDLTNDVFNMVDQSMDGIYSITSELDNAQERDNKTILREIQREVEEVKQGKPPGVHTGLEQLDKATGGFHPTDLTVLAARPAMGKTALALSCMYNQAMQLQKKCVFFSLEMSDTQLMKRLISIDSEINGHMFRNGKIEDEDRYQSSLKILETENIRIYDRKFNLRSIQSTCKRLKSRGEVDIVYIDYLQLIQVDGRYGTRDEMIGQISRTLKLMAKELDIPVIVLAQLSRKVEQRGGEMKPRLSDLRDSGAIEQDGDVVMFLHRPEYYGINEDEEGRSTDGLALVIYGKNRHGATGEKKIGWNKSCMKYTDRKDELADVLPPLGEQEDEIFGPDETID